MEHRLVYAEYPETGEFPPQVLRVWNKDYVRFDTIKPLKQVRLVPPAPYWPWFETVTTVVLAAALVGILIYFTH